MIESSLPVPIVPPQNWFSRLQARIFGRVPDSKAVQSDDVEPPEDIELWAIR